MRINNRLVLLFILPTLAPLILPPNILVKGIGIVLVTAALLLMTGYLLSRGNSLALTFTIFLQGLNFIVKMMLFYPTAVSSSSKADWPFAITALLSMAISFYLIFRLDQPDIRAQLRT